MGGLQADAAEPKGSRSACDPSLSDDEEALLPQMILEFNGSGFGKKGPGSVCVCVWKCSSHGMLAHLSVIYSMEEMKPGRFPSVSQTLLTTANMRVPEKMLEDF